MDGPAKARMIKAILPMATYGAEIGGLAQRHILGLRAGIRNALGRGARWRRAAELEIATVGGIELDPQVAVDVATIRLWQKQVRLHPAWWARVVANWDQAGQHQQGR